MLIKAVSNRVAPPPITPQPPPRSKKKKAYTHKKDIINLSLPSAMFNVRKFLSIEMTPTVRPEFKFSIAGGFFFFRWLFSCCRFLFIDNHHYKQPPFLPIICCRKRKKKSLTDITDQPRTLRTNSRSCSTPTLSPSPLAGFHQDCLLAGLPSTMALMSSLSRVSY